MSLQPPTDAKHALLCGVIIAALREHLPSVYRKDGVKVRLVDGGQGTHLAGCLIEVGGDVYEVEIRPARKPITTKNP